MTEEKWGNVKLTTFDVTKKKHPVFVSKSKALCAVKRILEALDPNFKNELPTRNDTVLDNTNVNQKAQIEAKIKNTIAINYLTLYFDKP